MDNKISKLVKKIETTQNEAIKKNTDSLNTVIDTFNMKMDSMKKQIDSIPVTIMGKINTCFQTLTKDIARVITQSMNQLTKDLNKTILSSVKSNGPVEIACEDYEQSISDHFDNYFKTLLIPQFEKGINDMIQQINLLFGETVGKLEEKITSNPKDRSIDELLKLQISLSQSIQNYLAITSSSPMISPKIISPLPTPSSGTLSIESLIKNKKYDDAFKLLLQRFDKETYTITICKKLDTNIIQSLSKETSFGLIILLLSSVQDNILLRLKWIKSLLLTVHPSDNPELYKQMKKTISPILRKLAHNNDDSTIILEAQVALRLLE